VDAAVRLTRFPLDIADLGEAHPTGVQVGGHVLPSSHTGLRAKDTDTPKDRYAVHAPADGYLVQVQHRVAVDHAWFAEELGASTLRGHYRQSQKGCD